MGRKTIIPVNPGLDPRGESMPQPATEPHKPEAQAAILCKTVIDNHLIQSLLIRPGPRLFCTLANRYKHRDHMVVRQVNQFSNLFEIEAIHRA